MSSLVKQKRLSNKALISIFIVITAAARLVTDNSKGWGKVTE